MDFFNKVLGKDAKDTGNDRERELKQELHGLELRKESVASAIQGEIGRLEAERTHILLAAGTKAYEVWEQTQAQADLGEYWKQLEDLKAQIAEQEQKKTKMEQQYDEEIRLISSNLNAPAPVAMQAAPAGGAQCPGCGSPIGANDLFCQKCGMKLQ